MTEHKKFGVYGRAVQLKETQKEYRRKKPLTKCQEKLLNILASYHLNHKQPTYQELADNYGCVKSNVAMLLQRLKTKNWVYFTPASKSGIQIL